MKDTYPIRKTVGVSKNISPLQRAFKLRSMVIEFTDKQNLSDDEHVRKTVGKVKPKKR